jgi:sirohydrochlorin ferrochelatase
MTYREPQVAEYWLILSGVHAEARLPRFLRSVEQELITGEVREITPNGTQKAISKVWKKMLNNLPELTA